MGSPHDRRWAEYTTFGPAPLRLRRGGGWSSTDACGRCGKGGDHECAAELVCLARGGEGPPFAVCGDVGRWAPRRAVALLPGGQVPASVNCAGCLRLVREEWPGRTVEERTEVSAEAANRLLGHFGVEVRMGRCEAVLEAGWLLGPAAGPRPAEVCERIVGHAGDHRSEAGTHWREAPQAATSAPAAPAVPPSVVEEVTAAVLAELDARSRAYAEASALARDRVAADIEAAAGASASGLVTVDADGRVAPLEGSRPVDPEPEVTAFSRRREPGDPPVEPTPWARAWGRLSGATAPQVPPPAVDEPTVTPLEADLARAHARVTELADDVTRLLDAVLGRRPRSTATWVGPAPLHTASADASVAALAARLLRLATAVEAAADEAEGR